jgi:hypothetical protein
MMKNSVRVVAFLILGIMLTGLAGCPLDKDKPPKIANLVYIPQQAPMEEGKTTSIIGTFNILRGSGETVSINTVVLDAQGKEVSSGSIPLSEEALRTSNTLGFGFDMSTSKKGEYTFYVYITDGKGRQSNKLEGTFTVTGLI